MKLMKPIINLHTHFIVSYQVSSTHGKTAFAEMETTKKNDFLRDFFFYNSPAKLPGRNASWIPASCLEVVRTTPWIGKSPHSTGTALEIEFPYFSKPARVCWKSRGPARPACKKERQGWKSTNGTLRESRRFAAKCNFSDMKLLNIVIL